MVYYWVYFIMYTLIRSNTYHACGTLQHDLRPVRTCELYLSEVPDLKIDSVINKTHKS